MRSTNEKSSLVSKLTTFNHQRRHLTYSPGANCAAAGVKDGDRLAIFKKHQVPFSEQQLRIVGREMKLNSYGAISHVEVTKKRPPGQKEEADEEEGNGSGKGDDAGDISVADIIGSFGWFQFLVLLFSGLREGAVGYDAVIMSVVLQPEWNFKCADSHSVAGSRLLPHQARFASGAAPLAAANISTVDSFQCFQSLNGRVLLDPIEGTPIRCQSWLFANLSRPTSLVADWSLVCDRHWLVAAIECAYFLGLVTGNLAWGYYADRVGRRRAYLLAHSLALLFGWLAVFMPTIEMFALCRFLCAFGSIGYNIIYSIQVEIIGTRHRSFSTTLNHLGWGLGVICVPFVDRAFSDYRCIIAMGPLLSLIMFPWAFWLPESSRWLMANDRPEAARLELIRAAKFNGKQHNRALEDKISLLNQTIRAAKQRQKQKSNKGDDDDDSGGGSASQYSLLFNNPILVRDTLLLSCASFSGHLFYYMLTINFGYIKNLSAEANFITSGAGEWFSVIAGALLLRICTRKFCMSLCLCVTALSFAFQALIDSGQLPCLDTELIITANNTIGTLSALLLIFVTLIVNQEVFPTVIRQTGSSIVNTLGESGSTIAPMLIQFARIVGPWRADALYSLMCLLAAFGVQFVSKTDDIELRDT